jgi:hypothetical protein
LHGAYTSLREKIDEETLRRAERALSDVLELSEKNEDAALLELAQRYRSMFRHRCEVFGEKYPEPKADDEGSAVFRKDPSVAYGILYEYYFQQRRGNSDRALQLLRRLASSRYPEAQIAHKILRNFVAGRERICWKS